MLPAILDPFAEAAAPAVMTRIALDWIVDGTDLDRLFDEAADGQYTREFALGHFVHVMLDVACGFRSSPRAAFRRRRLECAASLSAFYRKLNRMEPALSATVVHQTAERAHALIAASGGLQDEPVPGIVYEQAMSARFLPEISLAEVNAVATTWIPERNRAVAISAPERAGLALPTEAKLAAVIAGATKASWLAMAAAGASKRPSAKPSVRAMIGRDRTGDDMRQTPRV